MKTLFATAAAALAFTANAALAQETAPQEDPPLPPLFWEAKNFKIYAYDDANGLANIFILTCPDPTLEDDSIKVFLYDLDRFGLNSMWIDAKREAWKAKNSGLADEYPLGYTEGMVNPDGSVIAAENSGHYAQILTDVFALPKLPASAPVRQENVLQKIRSFAINFCYGVS